MIIQIITLFPEMFEGVFGSSIVHRARERRLVDIRLIALRDFGLGRHRMVDDYPFGGGPGMLLRADVVVPAVEHALAAVDQPARILWTSAQGRRLNQTWCREMAHDQHLVVVAGHYEGFDQRALDLLGGEEVSLGDFVLTGGEIPAMALVDAVVRLLPGALGDAQSAVEDSFNPETGWLEGPQYTRPATYRGREVPQVLLSGNHAKIAEWRAVQSRVKTEAARPDLLAGKTCCGKNRDGIMRDMHEGERGNGLHSID